MSSNPFFSCKGNRRSSGSGIAAMHIDQNAKQTSRLGAACKARHWRMGWKSAWSFAALVLSLALAARAGGERLPQPGPQASRVWAAQWGETFGRGTTMFELNGAPFQFTSALSPLPLEQLTAKTLQGCSRPDLPTALALSRNSGNEAIVACFEFSPAVGATSFSSRFARLLAHGDLNSLGRLRLIFARKQAAPGTPFLSATADSLPLPLMFPREGDAPGADLPWMPRPLGRRVLSVVRHHVGTREPLLAMYERKCSAAKALQSLKNTLEQHDMRIHRKTSRSPAFIARSPQATWLAVATQVSEGLSLLIVARLPD